MIIVSESNLVVRVSIIGLQMYGVLCKLAHLIKYLNLPVYIVNVLSVIQ